MPLGPATSGLLGLTDATSKAGPAGHWAAGWDASPSITARHTTTITLVTRVSLSKTGRRRRRTFHAPINPPPILFRAGGGDCNAAALASGRSPLRNEHGVTV